MGVLMIIVSWILVVLALVQVLVAAVQLYLLSVMKVVDVDARPVASRLAVVIPSLIVLVLAICAVIWSPNMQSVVGGLLPAITVIVGGVVAIKQYINATSIKEQRQKWDEANAKRPHSMSGF